MPPHVLSAENFLAEKFNVFPNPATNVVNITNGENIFVTEIAAYDVSGKLQTPKKFLTTKPKYS